MHGPPLTQQEAVASVARRVRAGEAQGLDREQAIRRISIETGIDPEKVRWSVETVFGAPAVRLHDHRHSPNTARSPSRRHLRREGREGDLVEVRHGLPKSVLLLGALALRVFISRSTACSAKAFVSRRSVVAAFVDAIALPNCQFGVTELVERDSKGVGSLTREVAVSSPVATASLPSSGIARSSSTSRL